MTEIKIGEMSPPEEYECKHYMNPETCIDCNPEEDTNNIVNTIKKLISVLDIDGETAEHILGKSLSEQVAKQYILTSDIGNIEEFLALKQIKEVE